MGKIEISSYPMVCYVSGFGLSARYLRSLHLLALFHSLSLSLSLSLTFTLSLFFLNLFLPAAIKVMKLKLFNIFKYVATINYRRLFKH